MAGPWRPAGEGRGRTVALVVLVAALALGGALTVTGGTDVLGGEGASTPTPTPNVGGTGTAERDDGGATADSERPDGAEGTTTPDRDASDGLAPGLARDGIANRTALLRAHRTAAIAAGYRSVLRIHTTAAGGGDNATSTFHEEVTVAEELSAYHTRSRRSVPEGVLWRRGVWSNGSITLGRSKVRSSRWRFSRRAPDDEVAAGLTRVRLLGRYLAAGNYTVAGTDRRNGRRLVVLRADRYRRPGPSFPPESAVGSFAVTVKVDSEGRIHELAATLRTGERVITIEYRLTEVGSVRFDRPTWIEKALLAVTSGEKPFAH